MNIALSLKLRAEFKELCDSRAVGVNAKDYAAFLEDRIAELEAREQWVRVGDKLPDDDVYMVSINAKGVWIGYLIGGRWLDEDGSEIDDVTHYQPLPTPPTEGEG